MTRQASVTKSLRVKLLCAAVSSCFVSGGVLANPTVPTVVHGNVDISGLGSNSVLIKNLAGSNAIINWNGFSISAAELTKFQQFANLAVLNRVTGPQFSSILGQLQSDGRVFLINPHGIVFGSGAQIDVAGLVASSLSLSDTDFLNGTMRFTPVPGAGRVENYGSIATPAGGQVYLVGPAVTNGGLISSPQGEVVLAAGNSVELVNPGTPGLSVSITAAGNEALNMGQILADSGRVGIFAGLINQGGMVSAGTAVLGVDGSIKLVATDSTTFAAGSQTISTGPLTIQTGDVTVAGNVQSGPQTIDATGAVVVRNEPGGFAQLLATGGQSISARSMELTALGGGSASIFNTLAGDQNITIAGGGTSPGLDLRTLSGGGFASIWNDAGGAAQRVMVTDADHVTLNGSGGGSAFISAPGGTQTVSITGGRSNALNLGSAGAAGLSILSAGSQDVTAGANGESGSISIVGSAANGAFSGMVSFPSAGNHQTVSTSGMLSIAGSTGLTQPAGTGVFQNGTGQQTVNAAGIAIQGGSVGTGNGGFINSSGSQQVNAGAGGITLIGGAGGTNNTAGMFQTGVDSALTQSITVSDGGSLTLRGGGGGTGNSVVVRANGGMQRINVDGLEVFGGSGGTMNFAVIVAPQQEVAVHGDLALTGGASLATPTAGGGALLGGGAAPTNLMLTVGGNVTLNGGSAAGSGSSIGVNNVGGRRTDITMNVGGNVTLNPGDVSGTRIGSPATNLAGGEIVVNAGGAIALNSAGSGNAGVIRTADGVMLRAREISQGPDAVIQANTLNIETQQGATLVGANAVNTFNATNFDGLLSFNNSSPLLTVSNVSQFMNGPLAINQTGDLRVNGFVSSGPQTINVTGGLVVQPEPFGSAQLSANGGQAINAGFVEVNATGGVTGVFNSSGDQRIATTGANAAGEGLAVRNLSGGYATIQNTSGRQMIDVRNADRVVLDSGQGAATVTGTNGDQTFSVTGTGGNALVLGSPGSITQSVIGGGGMQTVVAGGPGEKGSITIYGTASGGPFNNFIVSAPVPGGTQTVSTSGALTIFGGSAPGGTAAGIFANGIDGHQTVNAGSILLQGGSVGNGNGAVIGANSGSQTINAGLGGIALMGGSSTGANNFAQINQNSSNPAFTQTVLSEGPLQLTGGDAGSFNNASIRANGGRQSLSAGDTTLLGGGGGTDNFAAFTGVRQDIVVHGDLALTARGSASSPTVGGGTRIGGLGGAAPTGTNLSLNVDGDVAITGGSVIGTSAGFGNSVGNAMPTNVSVNAGGNVTLNGGTAPNTFATIGSRLAAPGGGEVVVNAGGRIALNSSGPDAYGRIGTAGGVTLRARNITQGANALIRADTLSIETQQGASLVGMNAVNSLSAVNSTSGAVAFNNTSPLLTVTGIDQVPSGALSLNQAGNLLIGGNVTSGAQTIAATGDITITPGQGPNVEVHANGAQSFTAGGHFSLLGGSAWNGYAQTTANGPVQVHTGGDLAIRGGSGFLAYGLLYGADDVRLTVGDELRLDGGGSPLAFARVQTDFWDRIYLSFPNRESGGYFVDGREGVTHRGLDGFFTGLRPAILGRSLILNYED